MFLTPIGVRGDLGLVERDRLIAEIAEMGEKEEKEGRKKKSNYHKRSFSDFYFCTETTGGGPSPWRRPGRPL